MKLDSAAACAFSRTMRWYSDAEQRFCAIKAERRAIVSHDDRVKSVMSDGKDGVFLWRAFMIVCMSSNAVVLSKRASAPARHGFVLDLRRRLRASFVPLSAAQPATLAQRPLAVLDEL
jgi:hypothetical protein